MGFLKRIGLTAALLACLVPAVQAETVRLAITDVGGMKKLQGAFGAFRETLSKATGQEIEFLPVKDHETALEALRDKKVDFLLTGPAEYVVIHKQTNARIVVGLSRPGYFSSIVTLASSPYKSVKDLKGTKVGLGDVGSTSKHLGPLQALADAGLDPRKDVEIVNFDARTLWDALKRGEVSAIGMTNTTFIAARKLEKKMGGLPPDAFREIARGPALPSDVLLAGTHVDDKVVENVRNAVSAHADELIAAILSGRGNKKYRGMRFTTQVKDSDYDYVRSMYATAGYPEYDKFVGN